MGHVEELVYAETDDGFLHAGVVIHPPDRAPVANAIVWVHGAGANFYLRPYILLARELAAHGVTSILGNNRGHDFGFFVGFEGHRPVYAGQGWEYFEHAPRDIRAWTDFAERQGFGQVVLLGHSLGATKALYAQAQHGDERVRGLVLASAPARLQKQSTLPAVLMRAQRMVRAGRGQDLLPWASLPGGGTLSAYTYLNRAQAHLDCFGLDRGEPLVRHITCPMLAFYGTNEEFMGTAHDLEYMQRNATNAPSVALRMVDGADHTYTGHEREVAGMIAQWIKLLPEPSAEGSG